MTNHPNELHVSSQLAGAMSRRRITVIALGLGIILLASIVALTQCSQPAEPRVKGLPLSQWLRSASRPNRELGAVAEAGTNAIPVLARAAEARQVIPYAWQARFWRSLPNSLRLKITPPVDAREVRQRALWVLREFGPEAEPALPAVLKAARTDPDIMNRSFAAQAAVAINPNHPQVLAFLAQALHSSDPMVRANAFASFYSAGAFPLSLTNCITLSPGDSHVLNELLALEALGADAAPFVPRILPFLSNESTRGNALAALDGVGPGGAAAVPALIDCLRASQAGAAARAAEILMRIGPAANAAVPALEPLMRDGAIATRVLAAAARWRITGAPAPSASVILAALQAKDDQSNWSLRQGAFGLYHYGFNCRMTALWFAGELGPFTRDALPLLLERMEKGPDWQRVVAARSVWKVEGTPDRALPVLKACLASASEETRILACYTLGEIGSPAAALIPDLQKAARTTLPTRRAALKAIDILQPKSSFPR